MQRVKIYSVILKFEGNFRVFLTTLFIFIRRVSETDKTWLIGQKKVHQAKTSGVTPRRQGQGRADEMKRPCSRSDKP